MAHVRVALVSPYSYTYPGGVGRHVEALAQELIGLGHDVRLLAPYDPDDRLARVLHRGASPQPRPLPDYVIPLGRTFGLPMNGAVTNLTARSRDDRRARPRAAQRRLRRGSRARAERAGGLLVRGQGGARTGGRHLPHLLQERVSEQAGRQLPRCAPHLLEAECPHRGVGGCALDRPALLRRALPDRAERGGPVRRAARPPAPQRGAEDPVHRPCGGAQGPARAAARLRGAARRRRPGAPHGRGARARGGRAAAARARGRGDRRARGRRREVAPAGPGRPALRPLARPRELRHGPDGGVRIGHSGRGLGHRRLSRRRPRRGGQRARAGRGRGGTGRGPAFAGLRPGQARRDGEGRPRARRALRVAERCPRGCRGLRGRPRRSARPRGAWCGSHSARA